jgi:hypothetical protein
MRMIIILVVNLTVYSRYIYIKTSGDEKRTEKTYG